MGKYWIPLVLLGFGPGRRNMRIGCTVPPGEMPPPPRGVFLAEGGVFGAAVERAVVSMVWYGMVGASGGWTAWIGGGLWRQ